MMQKKYLWFALPALTMLAFYLWWRKRQSGYLVDGNSGADAPPTNQPRKTYGPDDFKAALPKLRQKHGQQMAELVERIFRWETAHFESTQYIKGGTPGMEAHGPAPTYGWYVPFFMQQPGYLPIGTFTMPENGTGKPKPFVVMPSVEAAAMFLADYINRYNGNFARWYSTDAAAQESYRNKVMSVTPRFARGMA